ncbi:restriction endonuclease subunit S [Nocardia sp. NPDC058658]|uniref:restriction endonuclease subunit S n=1 Tax=Nocardia sp. NPDC058658 TaxID=3346580 RepID=UPI003669B71E
MNFSQVRLDSVATIERKGISSEDIPSDVPYIGLENIASGGELISVQPSGVAGIASSKFLFTDKHILFGKLRPYLAKIARPDFDGVCSTDILPILPGKSLDKGYLLHYLRQPAIVSLATSRSAGANLPRLSPSELATFEIPLPPIGEQRRIAEVLDRVDELRAKRRQSIALLDDLAQSIFLDMFGDLASLATRTLGECAEVSSGITKGRKIAAGQETREVPYLAVLNVQDKRLELAHVKRIAVTQAELERYTLRDGDLVLTEGGDPDKLGRGTVWHQEISPCIHQNHIFRVRLRPDAKVSPLYLNWVVSSRWGKSYFLKSAKQTTGIASINATQLRNFPVPVAPIGDQEAFARRIEAIAHMTRTYESEAARLDGLFSSLQSRAFKGELWKDEPKGQEGE